VAWVPGRLANPIWVDDPTFDVAYHVRRSGLPRPGTDEQLREFCARIQARPLDRRKPLWEMYLIEGLFGGRVAVATKTHYAIVDGLAAIDLEQVLLDPVASAALPEPAPWQPGPRPGPSELVLDAVADLARRPAAVADIVTLAVRDLRHTAGRARAIVGSVRSVLGALPALGSLGSLPALPGLGTGRRSSPLQVHTGERRRLATVRTDLADLRRVHSGQQATVNDVVLAIVAGALRGWLLRRGEPVDQTTVLRALVPLSVRDPSRIVPTFIDLPVGEPNPLVRLAQIAFAGRAEAHSGHAVGAETLVAIGGFAPPTLHAVAARVAGGLSNRIFQVAVTNVPGPQHPLYAGATELAEIYPIVPIARGQALAIGVTSYNGGVHFGINADHDALPDLDEFAQLIEESLAELVAANETAHSAAGAGSRRRAATRLAAVPNPGAADNATGPSAAASVEGAT
jgi:WS/DGAT/MGAT family acyltransferase